MEEKFRPDTYEHFMSMYRNPSLSDVETEDGLYEYAHDLFLDNVRLIEMRYPEVAEEDTNDETWYDELHDDVVRGYMLKIVNFKKQFEPKTIPFSNPLENIVGEVKDNSSIWDFLSDYGGSAYVRMDTIGMAIQDEDFDLDDELKEKSIDELKAMYDEQLALTLSVAFKAYANELNNGNLKLKTDFEGL